MQVKNILPAKEISYYVDRILVIDEYKITEAFSLPLFANGTPTLLFISAPATINNKQTNHLTLFGQTVFPENLVIRESFTLVAYFFKPFALRSLFGVSAKELTDHPIELNLLSSTEATLLKERLLNAADVVEMTNLLDAFIFRLITKTKTESSLVAYATNLIANNPGPDALIKAQKELFITERTFQRAFKENVGVSPDLFRRIAQFNTAFQQLNGRRFVKLSDIAFENGFSDQSHFTRTFKEFTNLTPKQYLNFGS